LIEALAERRAPHASAPITLGTRRFQ